MAIIHIYGARAISLLFYNNQDTEPESQVMEIGVDGSIFKHKHQRLSGKRISIIQNMGEKKCGNYS